MTVHDTTTPEGIESAKVRLNAIAKRKKKIEIKEYIENRSNKQNRYLHKCFAIIADEIGDNLEDVKHDVKIALGHYETTRRGNKRPKQTSTLNKKDFSELTEKFIYWAFSFHGIRLFTPEEYYKGGY